MTTHEQLEQPEALSESQQRMIALCEKLQVYKPKDYPLNEFNIGLRQPAAEVRQKVAETALGTLLLPEGSSLGYEPANEYYPDINLHVGTTALKAVGLAVYKYTWDCYEERDGEYVKNGRQDSLYILTLRFAYKRDGQYAAEEVGVETATSHLNTPLHAFGNVWAMEYAETGYEGHNNRGQRMSDEESLGAIALFEELVAHEVSGGEGLPNERAV